MFFFGTEIKTNFTNEINVMFECMLGNNSSIPHYEDLVSSRTENKIKD